MIAEQVWMTDDEALFTGETWSTTFEVTSALGIVKATMAYHDAPASVGSNPATVNDLDLVLISPSGTQYLGNNFSGGLTVPGGSSDTKNNVEQIHVGLPELGVWTAEVRGTALNLGLGGFGLVVTGPVEAVSGCAVDINGDTTLDIFDVLAYIGLFDGGDLAADWNGDTILDIFDVLAYLDAFSQGC
ncbi:MAG: hypothetical protein KDA28_13345 [Phycisphaerales bacterium]|nr:hypothetical protein [Phycisphaerales bacterium]